MLFLCIQTGRTFSAHLSAESHFLRGLRRHFLGGGVLSAFPLFKQCENHFCSPGQISRSQRDFVSVLSGKEVGLSSSKPPLIGLRRRRVLWLCGLTPILQVVSVICVLSISERECFGVGVVADKSVWSRTLTLVVVAAFFTVVPVNVRTFGFSVVVLTIVSFLVLETAWFVFRKRGTGHHHLVSDCAGFPL